MKQISLVSRGKLKTIEVLPQSLTPGEAIVKVSAVGICGTDMHYYNDGILDGIKVQYPLVMGHEAAGIILESSREELNSGTNVFIEPAVSCGECEFCSEGKENLCASISFMGAPCQRSGALSELISMPVKNCIPYDGGRISAEEALMAEPLSVALHAVSRVPLPHGARVCVIGQGPIGLLIAICLRINGQDVITIEKSEHRRFFSGTMGFKTFDPRDPDLKQSNDKNFAVFEAAGSPEAIDLSLALVRPSGFLIQVAIPCFEKNYSYISGIARRKEISIMNVRRQNRQAYLALSMIQNKLIDVRGLISHREPFESSDKLFKKCSRSADVIKAVVVFK
jgi:L-iditol 2-dehydrogenase